MSDYRPRLNTAFAARQRRMMLAREFRATPELVARIEAAAQELERADASSRIRIAGQFKAILEETARKHGVDVGGILKRGDQTSRVLRDARARHEVFHRLATETTLSLSAIGWRLGGFDRTAVHHGAKAHAKRMDPGDAPPRPATPSRRIHGREAVALLERISAEVGIPYAALSARNLGREDCVKRNAVLARACDEGVSKTAMATILNRWVSTIALAIQHHREGWTPEAVRFDDADVFARAEAICRDLGISPTVFRALDGNADRDLVEPRDRIFLRLIQDGVSARSIARAVGISREGPSRALQRRQKRMAEAAE